MTDQNRLEYVKTFLLTFLILLSFVLTGYLIFSAPSFEESRDGYLRPPFIGDIKNNQQSVYELAAPFQLVTHHQGHHAYSLPEKKEYDVLFNTIREVELTNFTEIEPTPEQWKVIFQESQGVELQFLHDSTIGQLDAFFKHTTLRDQPLIKDQKQISRIFMYIDPKNNYIWTWFISDETQTVIQAQTDQINPKQLSSQIKANSKGVSLIPYPINNKVPWDEVNKKIPFSRIIYFPNRPFSVDVFTYHLGEVNIEHMKQWLFKDPSVAPIQLNNNELLYMYNDPNMYNDQIITYNKQKNTMVYTNAPTLTEKQSMLIREELDEINQFIQRHRGWTNLYLLDQIQTEDHANEYIFRMFVNHLPVYWQSKATDSNPDIIKFQVKSGSINKYTRSLYFLSKETEKKTKTELPDQTELLQLIKQKKISLNLVKRLYPGYQAITIQGKKINLYPVWVIETTDGKIHFLSSPSKEGD